MKKPLSQCFGTDSSPFLGGAEIVVKIYETKKSPVVGSFFTAATLFVKEG
jgi:hypothetical protein